MVDLRALDRAGMEALVAEGLDEGPATALRIYKEVWQRGVTSIDAMTSVRRELREALADIATIGVLETSKPPALRLNRFDAKHS